MSGSTEGTREKQDESLVKEILSSLLPDEEGNEASAPLILIGALWSPGCQQLIKKLDSPSSSLDASWRINEDQPLIFVSNDPSRDDDDGHDGDGGIAGKIPAFLPSVEPHCVRVVSGPEAFQLTRILLADGYSATTTIPVLIHVDSRGRAITSSLTHKVLSTNTTKEQQEEAEEKEEHKAQIRALFSNAVQSHDSGDWVKALEGFSQVLDLDPQHADAAFNIAAILQMLGNTRLAVPYITMALLTRPDDSTAHFLLGTVLAEAESQAVISSYRHLVATLPPEKSHRAAHRLAVLTGEGESATSASRAYVQEVFDHMADTFEDKLVNCLEYRVPWQLYDAVSSCRPPPQQDHPWRILDLGCGTGLCGTLFKAYCSSNKEGSNGQGGGRRGAMIGVDVSPKMVIKAQETGAYTDVRVEDIHDALKAELFDALLLDLVLSADTFIYVGTMDHLFALTAQALRPGGLFAFSIEDLVTVGGDGEEERQTFRLVKSGRYAHSDEYVMDLAARHAFRLVTRVAVMIRVEQTSPIPGFIFVLEAAGHEQRV